MSSELPMSISVPFIFLSRSFSSLSLRSNSTYKLDYLYEISHLRENCRIPDINISLVYPYRILKKKNKSTLIQKKNTLKTLVRPIYISSSIGICSSFMVWLASNPVFFPRAPYHHMFSPWIYYSPMVGSRMHSCSYRSLASFSYFPW